MINNNNNIINNNSNLCLFSLGIKIFIYSR